MLTDNGDSDLRESQNSNIGDLLVIYFNENACDFIDIGNLVSVYGQNANSKRLSFCSSLGET